MGNNECGQLGINDLVLQQKSTPSLIKQMSEPLQISCGANQSYAVTADGLYSWGKNDFG